MKLLLSYSGKWIALSLMWVTGLLCAWSIASAEEFKKRLYINGGVGATHVEPESSSDAFEITDNNDTGGHLAFGYDFSRFLTLEAYAAQLGEAKVDFLGTHVGEVGYQVYGVSALGYLLNSQSGIVFGDDDTTGLFRREGASLYGRVGWGHMINDPSGVNSNRDYTSHAAFGLGVEYGFKNGIALRSELMTMDTDAKYWNIGILKRFGSVPESAPLAAAALPLATQSKQPAAIAQLKEPVDLEPIVPPPILFEFDSSTLDAEATSRLNGVAQALRENEMDIVVEGHTDQLADQNYNMSLSVRRAEAVANYLISQGVDRSRLSTVGYGEMRPISDNDTEEGRAQNRRSEIQIR